MIGAVIAMQIEADVLLRQMQIEKQAYIYGKKVYYGTVFGKPVLLVLCGVGKVNAAIGAGIALQEGATVLLNFGVAGGLNGSTQVAEIYAIDRAVEYDFDLTQLNGTKMGTLDEYDENYLPLCVPALNGISFPVRALGSGDRFNDSPVDHALLTDTLGADIRDMEGAAIAHVCKSAGIKCVSYKAISDVYGVGSTTDQYVVNRGRALDNLYGYMKAIVEAID